MREVELAVFLNLGLTGCLWNFPDAQIKGRQGPHIALNILPAPKDLSSHLNLAASDKFDFTEVPSKS
jgi:hypothetical protein